MFPSKYKATNLQPLKTTLTTTTKYLLYKL